MRFNFSTRVTFSRDQNVVTQPGIHLPMQTGVQVQSQKSPNQVHTFTSGNFRVKIIYRGCSFPIIDFTIWDVDLRYTGGQMSNLNEQVIKFAVKKELKNRTKTELVNELSKIITDTKSLKCNSEMVHISILNVLFKISKTLRELNADLPVAVPVAEPIATIY